MQRALVASRRQRIVERRIHVGEDTIHGTAGRWPKVDVVLSADVPKDLDLFMGTLGIQRVLV